MSARIDYHRIGAAMRLVRPLGLFSVAAGCVVLAGYAASVEPLYRPLANGPATHPLTALLAVLLGTAVILRRPRAAMALAALAFTLTGARLVEILAGPDLLSAVTPFVEEVMAQKAMGKPMSMGWNTTAMFLLVACSLLARRRAILSQVLASAAFALPLISVTGYAYAIAGFYGQMSLTTVCLGLPLTVAALVRIANRGVVRAVLSPFIGGRIARLQILIGYFGPFLIGLLAMHLTERGAHTLFALFVVMTSWLITWLVLISAVVQDRVDHKRRGAERRLEIAAGHDPLTGLLNRRNFVDQAEMERARAIRTGHPFALIMIDVDHFKRINDRAGHLAGDRVLLEIAASLRSQLRTGDIAARFGGEEFVVVLPVTGLDQAMMVTERIRAGVQALRLAELPADVATVTVSVGCTVLSGSESLETALSRADAALYFAKENGRNRSEMLTAEAIPTAA